MRRSKVLFGDVVENFNETVRNGLDHDFTRVVGLEHVDPGDPELRRWDELSELPDGTSFSRVFRRGHILFGKRRAYQRKVAVAPFDGICSSDILVFAPADGRILPEFLLYVVQSDGFFAHALQTSSGSLSPRTRWQDLANFEFELPSLDEQERIVELLSAVDKHAEALRTQLNVAVETRKSVLHNLLKKGGDGWAETTLGEAALVLMGQSPPGDSYNSAGNGLPFMQGSAEFGEHVPIPTTWCSEPAKIAEPGDLLISVRAPVGDTNFANQPIAIGRGLAIIRSNGVATTEFLRMSIQLGVENLLAVSGGGMFSSITAKNLRSFEISVPKIDQQELIVAEISKVDLIIEETKASLAATKQLRTALLNKEIS